MKSKTLVAKCNYLKWITLVHYKKITKCLLLHPSAHLGEWKSEMTVYRDGCKRDILYNTSLSTKMAVIGFSMGPKWKYLMIFLCTVKSIDCANTVNKQMHRGQKGILN